MTFVWNPVLPFIGPLCMCVLAIDIGRVYRKRITDSLDQYEHRLLLPGGPLGVSTPQTFRPHPPVRRALRIFIVT